MAKSMRSKREKRLRAIRREMVEPLIEKKDVAKLAAQEAALAAPKLPVPVYNSRKHNNSTAMDTAAIAGTSSAGTSMDVDMGEGNHTTRSLKPLGTKMKKKLKIAKKKYRGKGKIRRKNI